MSSSGATSAAGVSGSSIVVATVPITARMPLSPTIIANAAADPIGGAAACSTSNSPRSGARPAKRVRRVHRAPVIAAAWSLSLHIAVNDHRGIPDAAEVRLCEWPLRRSNLPAEAASRSAGVAAAVSFDDTRSASWQSSSARHRQPGEAT